MDSLRFTLVLVIVTGLFSFCSLVRQNHPESKLAHNSPAVRRSPSSAFEVGSKSFLDGPRRMAVIELDCEDEGQKTTQISRTVQTLRVLANGCRPSALIKAEIFNRTSGQAALTFRIHSRLITTDYMQLKSGKNRLIATYRYQDGSKDVKEITIVR